MKLRISIETEPLSGYITTVPKLNIDDVASSNECTEISAEVLDYIPSQHMLDVIKNYTSKLRHGGKIVFGGTDMMMVAKDIVTQRLNLVQANEILHGDFDSIHKNGQISMADLIPLLESLQLKIMRKSFNGYQFIVEAVRP